MAEHTERVRDLMWYTAQELADALAAKLAEGERARPPQQTAQPSSKGGEIRSHAHPLGEGLPVEPNHFLRFEFDRNRVINVVRGSRLTQDGREPLGWIELRSHTGGLLVEPLASNIVRVRPFDQFKPLLQGQGSDVLPAGEGTVWALDTPGAWSIQPSAKADLAEKQAAESESDSAKGEPR